MYALMSPLSKFRSLYAFAAFLVSSTFASLNATTISVPLTNTAPATYSINATAANYTIFYVTLAPQVGAQVAYTLASTPNDIVGSAAFAGSNNATGTDNAT